MSPIEWYLLVRRERNIGYWTGIVVGTIVGFVLGLVVA